MGAKGNRLMASKRSDVANELMASLEEALEIVAGKRAPVRARHPPAAGDVRAPKPPLPRRG